MAQPTRDTLASGRETIISLTQTEIMLVLAVVILLLLLAKNADLTAAEADVEAQRRLNVALEERTEATQEEILEQKTQADLAREVKDVLIRDGSGLPRDSATPSLQPSDVAAIEEALREKRQRAAEQQAVDEALQRAGVGSRERPNASRIEELGAEAGLAKVLRESLSPERRRELQEAVERDRAAARHDASQQVEGGVPGPEEVGASEVREGREDEAVKRLLAEWLRDAPTREGDGDQVGFDPCWPGPGGHRERRYYIAFDITYQEERFLVEPHADWRAGVAIVDRALSGPLAVLREYPRDWTTRESLHEFGRRIEEALKPVRNRGEYVDECLLVTTLNEEASGAVAKFLRATVRLYPITRDTTPTPR